MKGNAPPRDDAVPRERWRIDAAGAVQGVGFRPFVHRLATSEGLAGYVCNSNGGAVVEVEGARPVLERFVARLERELAPPAALRERRIRRVDAEGASTFEIAESMRDGARSALVLPDLAMCPACLADIRDPRNRRYRYPFTTCTCCGPRFSIIEDLPYDRTRTTMRRFAMCPACRAEYEDPSSRRFHAETIACPQCGPRLALWGADGRELAREDAALAAAAQAIKCGAIVALKGLGGFQLLVDATNDAAVRRLRERKHRPSKPFAVMLDDVDEAARLAELGPAERQLLGAAAAPIVLVRARSPAPGAALAASVAPRLPWLGIMLPYTPLHRLLMDELGTAIVATSGNRSGEPLVIDEREALACLAGIADLLLVHDRPIAHRVDDSVVRVMAGEPTVLRHARGYAPLVLAPENASDSACACLALGGHTKSAIALSHAEQLVLGPYIGDLDGGAARAAFDACLVAMRTLYRVEPAELACDTHPDYYTTWLAESGRAPVHRVPHHLAHVLAGLLDCGWQPPVLGVAWDGSGNGSDGTIWGGEWLSVEPGRHRRVAHLLPFRLPGGEAAIRDANRAALGALYAAFGDAAFAMTDLPPVAAFGEAERRVIGTMLERGVRSPSASSAGRLFDAAAAVLGLAQRVSYEGEAAIALEAAAERAQTTIDLPSPGLGEAAGELIVDWRATFAALVASRRAGADAAALAAGFHDALARAIVDVAERIGEPRVLLTGGCFQNARLAGRATAGLLAAGFTVGRHRRVPPNDGGLAVGQAMFVRAPLIEEKH